MRLHLLWLHLLWLPLWLNLRLWLWLNLLLRLPLRLLLSWLWRRCWDNLRHWRHPTALSIELCTLCLQVGVNLRWWRFHDGLLWCAWWWLWCHLLDTHLRWDLLPWLRLDLRWRWRGNLLLLHTGLLLLMLHTRLRLRLECVHWEDRWVLLNTQACVGR